MTKVHLMNQGVDSEVFELVKRIMNRQLVQRGCEMGDGGVCVSVCMDDSLLNDTYVLGRDGSIRANSMAGLLAGVGRYLVEGTFDGEGSFTPCGKDIALTPKKAVRGMYFASHFFNFYHVAPIEEGL